MRKLFKSLFLNNFKSIFSLLLNSKSRYFEIESIKLRVIKNCELGKKNSKIITRVDEIITPNILAKGEWDLFIIKFIRKKFKKKLKYNFIDVGANIGFITKQLIDTKIPINKYFCIEPEKINFNILKKNLRNNPKVVFGNFALTNKNSGSKRIYLNKKNFGDYSLLKKRTENSLLIETKNINLFLKGIIYKHSINNIIYKSDTQGFDEILILSLKKEFIKKIEILIIEISNFEYLKTNIDKFLKLTKNFDHIEDTHGNKIDENDIIKKLNDKKEFNLLLAKN